MAVSKKGIPHRRGIPIEINPALSEQEVDLGKGVAALGGSGSFAQGVVNLLGLEVEIPPDFKFPQGNLTWDLVRTMLVRMVSSESYFNGSELKEALEVADAWVNHVSATFKLRIDVDGFDRYIDATDVAKLVFAANQVCRESVKARPDLNTKQTLQLHCSVFLVAAATLFSKGEDGYFVLGSAQQHFAAKIVRINCEGVLNSFATGSIEPELQPQQTQENTMTNAQQQAQQAQQQAAAQAAADQAAAQAVAEQQAAQAVAEQQAAADQAAAQAAQQAAEQAVQAAIDDAVKKAVAQAIAQQAAQAAAQQAAQAAPVTPAPLAPAPAQAAQAAVPQAAAGVMSMADLIARSQQQQVAHDTLAAKVLAGHADLQARVGSVETKVAGFEARIAALEAAKTAASKTETTKVVVSGSSGSSSSDCLVDPTLDKVAAVAGYSLAGAGVAYLAMRLAETLMSRE